MGRRGELGTGVPYRANTANTFVVKAKSGYLYRVIIGANAAGAISIYDANGAVGTPYLVLKSDMPVGSYPVGVAFANGLTLVTAAATDVTLVYE